MPSRVGPRFGHLLHSMRLLTATIAAASEYAYQTRVLTEKLRRAVELGLADSILRADLEQGLGDTQLAHRIVERLPMWSVRWLVLRENDPADRGRRRS